MPWLTRRLTGWILLGLALASASLYSWNINSAGFSDYYATAAKSMSVSWEAFFFGAFDPQSTVTLDKLSGFLVPQALSARLFGFSAWSLAMPQVLEGVVTVVATYYIVSRWIGRFGGLVAATMMAFTPLVVTMFSRPMEDGMLTMCTTLSIAAWQRCVDTGKTRFLLLAGALVGLGFQAKMLQAWLVLPAMGAVYLAVAGRPIARKLGALAATAAVTVATSFSWMTAIALVPAAERPYIDGTTNNNIFSMVLGYNGIDRFVQNGFPGALRTDLATTHSHASTVGLVPGLLGHTPLKLFFPEYATQIGWLYPLGAAGLVLGVHALYRARRSHEANRGLSVGILLSGALLITLTTVLSVMSLPHTAYLASLALPLAALCAVSVVLLWRTFTAPASSRLRFALPITVAVQTGWALFLIAQYPVFAGWLMAPVAILGSGAAAGLLFHALGRRWRRRYVSALALTALTAALLGPFLWSFSTVDPVYAGTANDAYAGPTPAGHAAPSDGRYGIGLNSNRDTDHTAAAEAQIYGYAVAHSADRRYALATDSWRSAAPLILHGAERILPIGGFSSRIPSPSPADMAQLVARGELGYVLLTDPGSKNGVSTPNDSVHTWVRATCQLVQPADYRAGWRGTTASALHSERLFRCAP